MRISTTPNAIPQSTPPSSAGSQGGADGKARAEEFIFRSLVPRLVHPTKLAIIEALIGAGHGLSVDDLIPELPEDSEDAIRYHANSMVKTGVLEVASLQIRASSDAPCFYFPSPS